MDARDIIAKTIKQHRASPDVAVTNWIICELEAAGYQIIHDSENHGPTHERAATVLDVREQTELVVGERHKCGGRHYKAREAFHVARIARSDAAAIRTMKVKRDG